MPWKDLSPMDERVLFVADYVRELYSFSELCARYSSRTGPLLEGGCNEVIPES